MQRPQALLNMIQGSTTILLLAPLSPPPRFLQAVVLQALWGHLLLLPAPAPALLLDVLHHSLRRFILQVAASPPLAPPLILLPQGRTNDQRRHHIHFNPGFHLLVRRYLQVLLPQPALDRRYLVPPPLMGLL